MIIKVNFICALIILQNFFLINPLSAAQKYIEVDKIVAIVETQTITNSDGNRLVSALIRVACVDLKKMKPIAIPEFILGEISRVI